MQIGDEIVGVFDADGEADEAGADFEGGAGGGEMSHGGGDFNEGLHATQGFGQGEYLSGFGDPFGSLSATFDLKREHAAASAHMLLGEGLLGMGGVEGIVELFHLRVFG